MRLQHTIKAEVLFSITHWAACFWFIMGERQHTDGSQTWVEKEQIQNLSFQQKRPP